MIDRLELTKNVQFYDAKTGHLNLSWGIMLLEHLQRVQVFIH